MKKYLSFFKMRMIAGLQYRAAAIGGLLTQAFWGIMGIMVFAAFYQDGADRFPISMQSTATYLWLQQAFLVLFRLYIFDNEIFECVRSGNVAYELCRPADTYYMWLASTMAMRLSKVLLRCVPILIVGLCMPKPYGIALPENAAAMLWFFVSMLIGWLVVSALGMIVYMSAFFTVSVEGIKVVGCSLVEFLAGQILPIPFFPPAIRTILEWLPFSSIQNVPLLIYSGDISGGELYWKVGLQIVWAIVLLAIGKAMYRKGVHRVVLQGG